jgi:hypothetical protein
VASLACANRFFLGPSSGQADYSFRIDFLASRLSSATGFSNGYYEYPTDRLDDTLKLQEVNIPTKPATGAGSTIPPPAPAAVDVLRTDTFDVEYTPRKDSRTPTQ